MSPFNFLVREKSKMPTDIFDQEERIVAKADQVISNAEVSISEYRELATDYKKLLRTTKKIVKLSDKNEKRLNELKEEAQQTNSQLEGMSAQLSKFLSPQLYNSIFSGSQDIAARVSKRKKLTVFFSDLCGFTDFVENLESEDVTDLLNLYLETMTNIAIRYGATIDKYIGDGIMLFFGDPESDGIKEDAVKCVRMALEMLHELENLADQWVKYGLKEQLQMRIGIDTGFATVGNFGCESRLDYTAIGAAVNRASRLESAAENGSILISEDTYNLVKEEIEADALPPIHLKGVGEYRARRVIRAIDSRSVSVNLGNRTLSMNLEAMSVEQLDATRKSAEFLLRELSYLSSDDVSR